jgi:hypothetical protein
LEVVEQYYPEIEENRVKLSKLSDEISILFQILIVENKEYERADFYAYQLGTLPPRQTSPHHVYKPQS